MEQNNEKKKIGLTTWIFIALLVGAFVGVILHYVVPDGSVKSFLVNGLFYIIGNGFLRAMQMLVVPLVFCSLVCGSMSIGDTKRLGKVGVKTMCFYLFTTALAITVALTVGNIINPGNGLDVSSLQSAQTTVPESKSFADVLLDIVPKNPINSLSQGNMLQIILFSLVVGIILAKISDETPTVSNFFNEANKIMMEMTMMVMKLAPIGVFCLIAKTFSGIGFNAFLPLIKYMLGVFIALGLQCFGVYLVLLKVFTKLSPIKFIKKFLPVMGFAFSTATSNATIPMSIETLKTKMGVSKKISSFTIPLGATINMDGTSIMQGVAVIFIAQAYGMNLSVSDLATVVLTATIASIGTAGVPSVGLVTLAMVLNSVGLPTEGIALIMGIDRILDMIRTAVNITGDAVCTTIVSYQEKELDVNAFHSAN